MVRQGRQEHVFAIPDHDPEKLADGNRATGHEGLPVYLNGLRAIHRGHQICLH